MVTDILKMVRKIVASVETTKPDTSEKFFEMMRKTVTKEDSILMEKMTDRFGVVRCETFLAKVVGSTSQFRYQGKGLVSPRNCTCRACMGIS